MDLKRPLYRLLYGNVSPYGGFTDHASLTDTEIRLYNSLLACLLRGVAAE